MSNVHLQGKFEVNSWGPGHGVKIDRNDPETFRCLVEKLPKCIKTLKMPNPSTANSLIITNEKDYQYVIEINGVSIVGMELEADGVMLNDKTEAFAILSAGCPTIVFWATSRKKNEIRLCAAHAGRDSLVSMEILTGKGGSVLYGRKYFSVLHAAIDAMKDVSKEDIFMSVHCGVRTGFTHPISHPEFAEKNKILIDYCNRHPDAVRDADSGEIDLYSLIRGQAIEFGLDPKKIIFDGIDTGNDPNLANYRTDPEQRNLLIVYRL